MQQSVKKKSKGGTPKTTRSQNPQEKSEEEKKRLAAVEVKIRRRVACEEKAFRIVERMVEGTVEQEFFCDAAKFIDPSHYNDIVEERSITQTCGYPICENQLTKVPKQKYHISTKSNKVYDITDRKKYCSPACYKASSFYRSQIPTSAVWMRENEQSVSIVLMPHNKEIRGGSGEEIVIDPTKALKKEVEMLEEAKGAKEKKENLEDIVEKMKKVDLKENDEEERKEEKGEIGENSKEKKVTENRVKESDEKKEGITEKSEQDLKESCSEQMKKLKNLEELLDRRDKLMEKLKDNNSDLIKKEKQKQKEEEDVKETHSEQLTTDKTDAKKQPQLLENNLFLGGVAEKNVNFNPAFRDTKGFDATKVSSRSVLKNIQRAGHQKLGQRSQNVKVESVSILEALGSILLEWKSTDTVEYFKQEKTIEEVEKDEFQKKYEALGRRVDKYQVSDLLGADALEDEDDKPKKMRPEYQMLKLETEGFEMKVKEFYGNSPAPKEENNEKPEIEVRLPVVDSLQQMTLRRNIVWDRLQHILPDVLGPMNLTLGELSTDVRALISTFRFTSHNVSLKPAEWSIMAYLLIKLLARKLPWLRENLVHHPPAVYFSSMMTSLGITEELVDELVDRCVQPVRGQSKKTVPDIGVGTVEDGEVDSDDEIEALD